MRALDALGQECIRETEAVAPAFESLLVMRSCGSPWKESEKRIRKMIDEVDTQRAEIIRGLRANPGSASD